MPITGAIMHPEYVKAIGRFAYILAWPMVNMFNRRAGITQAPEPGRLGGVVPVAPRGRIGMLNDYVLPDQSFVACPNQDVAYGAGFFSLDIEPVVAAHPGDERFPNWLPAPDGEFSLYLRAYWGEEAILDGSWQPPEITKLT